MKTRRVRAPGLARALHLGGLAALSLACSRATSVPSIACTTTYGGQTQTIQVAASAEPYSVVGVSVADRFEFRPVLSRDGTGAWLLSVYSFDLGKNPAERTLIHQLKMVLSSPNAPTGEGRYGVTGRQFVYEHNGRELQYWCGFRRE